jgi:hypothetical protein
MRMFASVPLNCAKFFYVQCEALSAVLPGKVIGPSDPAGYQRLRKSYWTQQESTLSPGCFVQPWDANDVSTAIKVLNQPSRFSVPGCKFAIKSGGWVERCRGIFTEEHQTHKLGGCGEHRRRRDHRSSPFEASTGVPGSSLRLSRTRESVVRSLQQTRTAWSGGYRRSLGQCRRWGAFDRR